MRDGRIASPRLVLGGNSQKQTMRTARVELALAAWKAAVLPLYDVRMKQNIKKSPIRQWRIRDFSYLKTLFCWGGRSRWFWGRWRRRFVFGHVFADLFY